MPIRCPIDVPRWHAASLPGGRRLNADASAVHSAHGRTAYVVADGVGDTEAAAAAARIAANAAARAAVTEGPVDAILAAADAIADIDGDCVLVVAVPDGLRCDIAWVGDCRAYHSNGRVLQQITVDHTVAEYYRARNAAVLPKMEHQVTTSVRTAGRDRIGVSSTGLANGRLLLCSDGVHKPMTATELRTVLDQPKPLERVAEYLVRAAFAHGGRDNATALLIERSVAEASVVEAA